MRGARIAIAYVSLSAGLDNSMSGKATYSKLEQVGNDIILYKDYKEPLRTVASVKGEGFGYMGTLAMSEDRELVQCHVCGELLSSINNSHVKKHEFKTIAEYKKEFGLSKTTVLMGDSLREKHRQAVVKNSPTAGKGLPKHLEGHNEARHNGTYKLPKRSDYSLEWRNKKGLCPDQVLEKILDLKDKLGRMPSVDEFKEEYEHRYFSSIRYLYGSWTNAVEKLGEQTREQLKKVDKDKLVDELKLFYEIEKRIPTTSDFNRGMLRDKNVFIRAFGTLNNARIEAGMNAVVPLGNGKFNYIELTAQEYLAYLDGHIDTKSQSADAKKARARRKRIAEDKRIKEYL